MALGPVGTAVGLGMKAIKATGGLADGTSGNVLSSGTNTANDIASYIPGLGWLGSKTHKANSLSNLTLNSGAYTGEANDVKNA
jgi:hypothetical protein